MPLALVSSSISGTTDSNSSSCVVPVPPGTEAGHIVLLAMENWETYDSSGYVWPPGFVVVVNALGGNRLKLFVAWKRLEGPETGDYQISWVGNQWNMGHCLLVSGGQASGDPIEDTDSGASSGTVNLPPLSVATTTAALLAHFVTNENSASATPPAGFVEIRDGNYLKSNYQVLTEPGTVITSGGATSIPTSKVAALVAVRPDEPPIPPNIPVEITAGKASPEVRLLGAMIGAESAIASGSSTPE